MDNQAIFRARALFGVFIFLPLFACFLFPMLFYKWPVLVVLHAKPAPFSVDFKQALDAFGIAALWFVIALSVLCLPVGRPWRTKPRPWSPHVIYAMALLFGIIGISALLIRNYVPMPTAIKQPIYLFSHMPMMSIVFSLYAIRLGYSKSLLYSCIVLNSFFILWVPLSIGTASSIAFTLIAILYALLCLKYSMRKIFVLLILSGFIIVGVMLVKDYVRYLWGTEGILRPAATASHWNKKALLQGIQNDFNAINETVPYPASYFPKQGLFKYFYYPAEKVLVRLNRLSQFAYVLQVVPKEYPFLKGYTYQPILGAFIPRLFWKNKPIIKIGPFFAHQYGFVKPKRKETSIALPYPTEAWLNYGWFGILISALLVGFIFRLCWSGFMGGLSSPGNIMIGMVVVYAASRAEANAMTVFGNLIQAVIVFWCLDVAIRWYSHRCIKRGI